VALLGKGIPRTLFTLGLGSIARTLSGLRVAKIVAAHPSDGPVDLGQEDELPRIEQHVVRNITTLHGSVKFPARNTETIRGLFDCQEFFGQIRIFCHALASEDEP
jgi:hypothetical protein